MRIETKNPDIRITTVSAGDYYTDAGAAMGVLPKAIWKKYLQTDENDTIKMALNCLLIQNKNCNILVDTGVGNLLSDKQFKIYRPGHFSLLENLNELGISRHDIHHVVFTHLHFDHIGGILHKDFPNELTFPNAYHHIQKKEWLMATNPNELNQAAYPFREHINVLSDSIRLDIIDGDTELFPNIHLQLVQGHSEGMQIVKIMDQGRAIYYAGDMIPSFLHLSPSVTSAYELCRKTSYMAKIKILKEVKETQGLIIMNHDPQKGCINFDELR
ncbi:MAG TPA: MBL fold metallo-hydrolase [Candidatus Cloacimonadota bacterium]|nr:MBL fold metallo-hydrolase [Candidatus Cloacimonadota bacterium]